MAEHRALALSESTRRLCRDSRKRRSRRTHARCPPIRLSVHSLASFDAPLTFAAVSKDLKHVRQGVCKPYSASLSSSSFLSCLKHHRTDSACVLVPTLPSLALTHAHSLGEQFRSIWDVQPATYDATSHTLTCTESLDPDHKIVEPNANASRTSIDGADDTASLSSKRSSRIPSSTSDGQLADATKSKLSLSSQASSKSGTETTDTTTAKREKPEGLTRVVFLNEQVSHHPPISAFWNESVPANPKGQKVVATGYDQISAKFTGTSPYRFVFTEVRRS